MKKLEERLCKSVSKAFKRYEYLTENWLLHAPEHFLQNYIFLEIGKKNWLYAEATNKKIVEGEGRPRKGRPPAKSTKRHDLVVWQESSNALRSVIEIKRSWSMNDGLRKDVERLRKSINGRYGAKSAYLIVYTETKNTDRSLKIDEKLQKWAGELGVRYLNSKYEILGADESWTAGFGLFRV